MEYNIVSGDSHVDMSMLPGDLFVNNAPAHLKDQVPHIEDTKEGPRWVAEGRVLGVVQSAGFEFIPAQRGRWKRTDRMLDAGFYDGRGHPTDPELRLKDMIMDGVDGEVLYGITGTGKNLKDREIIAAVYRMGSRRPDHCLRSSHASRCASVPRPAGEGRCSQERVEIGRPVAR